MRKIQGRKVKNNQNGLVSFSSINVCMNQKIRRIFFKKIFMEYLAFVHLNFIHKYQTLEALFLEG